MLMERSLWLVSSHSASDVQVGPKKVGPQTHDHTLHYNHLTASFPGQPGWAGTRKEKPIWILLEQETVSCSGISWAICKPAPRPRQITTPVPHHSVFYRPDALPAAQPTASKHWRNSLAIRHTVLHKSRLRASMTDRCRSERGCCLDESREQRPSQQDQAGQASAGRYSRLAAQRPVSAPMWSTLSCHCEIRHTQHSLMHHTWVFCEIMSSLEKLPSVQDRHQTDSIIILANPDTFQSPVRFGHDPYCAKKSRSKAGRLKS